MLFLCVVVDTTRVTIREADPDVSGSDYINANYIRVSQAQVESSGINLKAALSLV